MTMSDPYEALGLDAGSVDDEQVHAAYLRALRAHAPDQDPEGFQRVRDAYEQLRTRRARIKHELFEHQDPDVAEIARQLLKRGPARRPSESELRQALAAYLDAHR